MQSGGSPRYELSERAAPRRALQERASFYHPLAEAGVSIFALSTFDTDYLLVSEQQLARAVGALFVRATVSRGGPRPNKALQRTG